MRDRSLDGWISITTTVRHGRLVRDDERIYGRARGVLYQPWIHRGRGYENPAKAVTALMRPVQKTLFLNQTLPTRKVTEKRLDNFSRITRMVHGNTTDGPETRAERGGISRSSRVSSITCAGQMSHEGGQNMIEQKRLFCQGG